MLKVRVDKNIFLIIADTWMHIICSTNAIETYQGIKSCLYEIDISR
jgi:hypothetical protein